MQTAHPSTLDEPVSATIMRDVKRIGSNLRTVLLPVRLGGSGDRGKVVRDWDLWGPMIFSLLLSISLSIGSKVRRSSLVVCGAPAGVTFGSNTAALLARRSRAGSSPSCSAWRCSAPWSSPST